MSRLDGSRSTEILLLCDRTSKYPAILSWSDIPRNLTVLMCFLRPPYARQTALDGHLHGTLCNSDARSDREQALPLPQVCGTRCTQRPYVRPPMGRSIAGVLPACKSSF